VVVDRCNKLECLDARARNMERGVMMVSKTREVVGNTPSPAVTEDRQAGETPGESEELYRSMIELSPDSIFTIDTKGVITLCNAAATRLLDYSKDELVGKHFSKLGTLRLRDIPKYLKIFRSVLGGSIIEPTEVAFHRKDGTTRLVDVHVVSLKVGGKTIIQTTARDITERKWAEEELRLSDAAFKSLQESVVVTDTEYTITRWNEVSERIYGIKASEAIGKKLFDIIEIVNTSPGETAEQFKQGETQSYYQCEQLHRTKHAEVWVYVSVQAIEANGKRYGWVALATDVTERKQAEEELREAEERYRDLFESANDLIQSVTPDGHFLYVNKAWREALGYSEQEVANLELWDIIHPDSISHCREVFQKIMSNKTVSGIEAIFVTKDGKSITVEGNANCRFEEGKPVATRGIFRDITERKRVEEELRIKDSAIASSINAIAIADLEGNLTYVNPSFLALWGYDDDKAVLGKSSVEFWQMRNKATEVVDALRTSGSWLGELVAKRKDGSTFDVQLSASMVTDEEGKPICMMASFVDITERKRVQQALQEKTRQLAAASQAKSKFLASMSHELRTPLNAVIGFSELMLDGVPGEINDEQRDCLNDILSSGQQLLNLINDVLNLSKIEAGRMELKLENLNLADVINDVVQTVKPMLDENRHKIGVSVGEGLPQVHAEKRRLRQILLNLLSNAIKFTPPGGKLGIKVTRNGDWCQVSVVDNGIGIKEEDQERVFEVFTQVATLPKEKEGGTGLGLALTKQFVESIGGRIWVESQYGKGSKFTFTLPLVREGEPYSERE